MDKWRFIPVQTNAPTMNMALDEACLQAIAQNKVLPTIRFYRWRPDAITIGYFQNITREVSLNKCVDIPVIRRLTGGGAVYHDFAGELTYSVIAPSELFPKNIIESYKLICEWIINGLRDLGIEAKFHPINDILSGDKKISGNAQARKKGVLLQHGTILYKVDLTKMFNFLKVPDEKIRHKMISKASERVTSLTKIKPDLSFNEFVSALQISFLKDKQWEEGSFTTTELKIANQLMVDKYQSEQWNYLK